jgi:hypothetical protein
MRFAELFESAASRSEVICTFLALLELIRLRQLVCSQPEPFGEIEIRLAAPAAGASVPAAPNLPSEGCSAPAPGGTSSPPPGPAATPATQPAAAPANQSTDAGNAGQASSLSQT